MGPNLLQGPELENSERYPLLGWFIRELGVKSNWLEEKVHGWEGSFKILEGVSNSERWNK